MIPLVVVGDVHGDLPGLVRALGRFAPPAWRTIVLGDVVDGGDFGVGALRWIRDRPNTELVIGNHEVMILAALEEYPGRGPTTAFWQGMGGQLHDLRELAGDPGLQAWLRMRPALIRIAPDTLLQHCDSDSLLRFVGEEARDAVALINEQVHRLLDERDYQPLWDAMTERGVFERQPMRLEAWLRRTGSRRVVHGHTPMRGPMPRVYAAGRAVGYDGGRGRTIAAPLPLD
ncbi:MAG TPA: metallophosphoesterase [Candidatus Nitrosotalea sp.]|nr:metallophosphoesterase [Candidatus Nitrosotalea sp.]